QLSVSEVGGSALSVGNAVSGTYGSVARKGAGSYTYVLGNANAAVNALNAGQTLSDAFTYQVSDGAGGFDTTSLTITIHGTDDNPVAVADTGSANEAWIMAVSNATAHRSTLFPYTTLFRSQLSVSEVGGSALSVGNAVSGTYGS